MHGLDWVDADSDPFTLTDLAIGKAKQALDDATEVVLRREANYGCRLSRLQAGPNPTSYDYTYLWTA